MTAVRRRWRSKAGLCLLAIAASPVLAQEVPMAVAPSVPGKGPGMPRTGQVPAPTISLPEIGSLPSGATRLRTIRPGTPQAPPTLELGDFTLEVAKINAPDNPILARFSSLRRLGDLVRVRPVETTIDELSTGLLIRQTLRFELRLGACRTAGPQLAEAGVACGTAATLAERVQALGNPADRDNYVADPARRMKAVEALTQSATGLREEVRKTRDYLATPAAVTLLGAGEVARLSALSDDSLIAEVMDSGETEIAQGIFLPALDRFEIFTQFPGLGLQPYNLSPRAIDAVLDYSRSQAAQAARETAPSAAPDRSAPAAQASELPPVSRIVGRDTFLAGFTLGKEYEWRWRVQKTVNWCIWGCKSTYFIEPYASLGLGLGLRFPIRTSLLATRNEAGDAVTVKPTITAANGDENDYRAAGLEDAKLFDGKELVAEYSYLAGIRYALPRHSGNWSIGDAHDFTRSLPRPFTNGQFRPPSPGRDLMTFQKVFTEIDLLGRQADYGIVSAALYPAVKVNLSSDELSMRLADATPGGTAPRRVASNDIYPVKIDGRGQASVTLGQPRYNLSFKITPGLNYLLKVDLAVWSKRWTDTIWIPDLEIRLPPGGAEFGCHAGTVCERTYSFGGYVPSGGSGTAGGASSSPGTVRGAAPGKGRKGGAEPGAPASQSACDTRQIQGRWALRDLASQRFVRGGVTGEGQNDLVGLGGTGYAADPARDWATFEIFEIVGMPGGRRLRNTIDGRWLETSNTTNSLMLPPARTCSVSNPDMQWQAEPASDGYYLRSMRTGLYVRFDRGGLLKADAQKAQASRFEFGTY